VLDSSIFHSAGQLGRSAKRLLRKQENRKLIAPLPLLAPPKAKDGLRAAEDAEEIGAWYRSSPRVVLHVTFAPNQKSSKLATGGGD